MAAEPVIVTDQPGAATAGRRLARQGWTRADLDELPAAPWDLGRHRLFCTVAAADEMSTSTAMVAAVRGVRLVVIADIDLHATFLDDLARLAPTEVEEPGPAADRDALLALLVEGMTVTSAAQALHVSRRTANRWLSLALAEYGVDSTAAAVREWATRQAGR